MGWEISNPADSRNFDTIPTAMLWIVGMRMVQPELKYMQSVIYSIPF